MGRVMRLWVEAKADKGRGAEEGQTATKQLLGAAGLPCVIYCSTG